MRISDWSSDVCSSDLVLLPFLTAAHPIAGGAETWASTIFSADVRFFGAGVIGVAAVWTLVKIAGPVIGGIRSAMAASRARAHGDTLALEERDLPLELGSASRGERVCQYV